MPGEGARSEKPPEIPGRKVVLWKKPGARKWSAVIRMPNGYEEVMDTEHTDKKAALAIGTNRVRHLYKELGLESPRQQRIKAGLMVPKIGRRKKAAGDDDDADDEPPPPGPTPMSERPALSEWGNFVLTTEKRYMRAFMRIQELLLLGLADDPEDFVRHLRAIVIETVRGVRNGKGA